MKLGKKEAFLRLHQTLSRSQKLGRNEVAFSTAFYFYEFLFFLSEKANRTFKLKEEDKRGDQASLRVCHLDTRWIQDKTINATIFNKFEKLVTKKR